MRKTITREILIDVCDQCGLEEEVRNWTSHRPCISCGKDLCPGCQGRVEVEVRRIGKMTVQPMKSYSVGHQEILGSDAAGYSATYCMTCANGIQEALIAAGLVPRKLRPAAVGTTESD